MYFNYIYIMSNQFFFGYAGNKRKETQKLYEHVESKLKHIKTMREPLVLFHFT